MTILLAILASGVGAFLGGYVLIHPAGGAGLIGIRSTDATGLRALGGALILSHAAATAILAQAPGIGACFAAGLGTAWMGAAAGRAIGALAAREKGPGLLLMIGAEALLGLLLWAPLWRYLQLMRRGAMGGSF